MADSNLSSLQHSWGRSLLSSVTFSWLMSLLICSNLWIESNFMFPSLLCTVCHFESELWLCYSLIFPGMWIVTWLACERRRISGCRLSCPPKNNVCELEPRERLPWHQLLLTNHISPCTSEEVTRRNRAWSSRKRVLKYSGGCVQESLRSFRVW